MTLFKLNDYKFKLGIEVLHGEPLAYDLKYENNTYNIKKQLRSLISLKLLAA